jgi:hypothetical protein
MKLLISLSFLFVSILYSESFGVLPAWGNDLKVTLANEVAGITPGMEILSPERGSILENEDPDMVANSGTGVSYLKKDSKAKKTYYSPNRKIINEKRYAAAGFIVPNIAPVGKVSRLMEQKLAVSGPDKFYVDIGKRQGIEKGDRFTVYTLDRYIFHPVLRGHGKLEKYTRRSGYDFRDIKSHPGKPVGYRVKIHGVIEITEPGDKVSYARVLKSYDTIAVGDLLMPYQKFEDKTSTNSGTDKSIEGYIIASKGDKIGIHDLDIIYIDKGWEDEVRPGDQFEVYSIPDIKKKIWNKMEPQKTPLLPLILGKIKVIDTQKKTATAVVLKSNVDIVIGNRIRFKPSHHPG